MSYARAIALQVIAHYMLRDSGLHEVDSVSRSNDARGYGRQGQNRLWKYPSDRRLASRVGFTFF